jgi:hypothetical protein
MMTEEREMSQTLDPGWVLEELKYWRHERNEGEPLNNGRNKRGAGPRILQGPVGSAGGGLTHYWQLSSRVPQPDWDPGARQRLNVQRQRRSRITLALGRAHLKHILFWDTRSSGEPSSGTLLGARWSCTHALVGNLENSDLDLDNRRMAGMVSATWRLKHSHDSRRTSPRETSPQTPRTT